MPWCLLMLLFCFIVDSSFGTASLATQVTGRKLHPFNPAFTLWTKNPYFKKFGHVPTSGVSLACFAHHGMLDGPPS